MRRVGARTASIAAPKPREDSEPITGIAKSAISAGTLPSTHLRLGRLATSTITPPTPPSLPKPGPKPGPKPKVVASPVPPPPIPPRTVRESKEEPLPPCVRPAGHPRSPSSDSADLVIEELV